MFIAFRYTAQDSAGNMEACSFTVDVRKPGRYIRCKGRSISAGNLKLCDKTYIPMG